MTEQAKQSAICSLTLPEREVLDLLVEFKTSSQIADALGIPVDAVSRAVESAQRRLGARSRAELARTYNALLREDPATDLTRSVRSPEAQSTRTIRRFLKTPPLGGSRRARISLASTTIEVFRTAYLGMVSVAGLTVFVLAFYKTVN